MSISTPFSSPVAAVQVTIGGQPAEVLYAGEAPFEPVGVLQVNARIPAGVSGPAQVSIQVGDVTAAPIRIN
jgi:uncharacterized protein (TIGR03437 family)